jgi:hypothetical protein
LIDRRLRLLAHLDDDVLDLSSPAATAAVLAASRSSDSVSRRFRTIVSVAELVRFPDLVLALTGVERLLDDDGEVWFIEPVHHTGGVATVVASLWAKHPAVSGAHVERDVPLAARAAGLTFTDLERFAMPTGVYPLRLFIQGRARRSYGQAAA